MRKGLESVYDKWNISVEGTFLRYVENVLLVTGLWHEIIIVAQGFGLVRSNLHHVFYLVLLAATKTHI